MADEAEPRTLTADGGAPAADERSGRADPAGGDAGARPDSGEQGEPGGRHRARKTTGDQPPLGNAYQYFYGNVYAEQGTFGAGNAGPAEGHGSARAQGRMEETEVTRIVRAYAEPACYEQAARTLIEERVIILTGEAGVGRRTGAISMLSRARAPKKPLVGFSPAITVEELAARSFDEGAGYLVSDMFDGQLAPELADFHWRNVCHKVRRSKAYLVVTSGARSQVVGADVVRQFTWQRPELANALRAHLGAVMVDDEVVEKVAAALGSNFRLADIGAIARRISGAADIGQVLADLQETDRLAVASWLDEVDTEIPAVLEVAAMAFTVGVPERIFETELEELKLRIAEFAPETDAESKEGKETRGAIDLRFRQLRRHRANHPLLTIRQVPVARGSGSLAIRHVDFRVPAYRQHVVAELWDRLGSDFWAAVRRWLQDIAADDHSDPVKRADLINSMATGLALLGLVAPDEVIDCYLDPWTAEGASLSEETMALYVVWHMSMLDQLAPLALQIAIVWAGQGSRTQRRMATYAFSGELGVRYPLEAVKRLSQLADQGETITAHAYGQLFATLAGRDSDAVVVLQEMRKRMNAKTSRPEVALVLETATELLSIRDPRSGRTAIAVFLIANPCLAGDVAPLWARAVYLRPWREPAITAVLHTIMAIEHGAADPEALARSLGSEIGRELPPEERRNLRADVLRRGADRSPARPRPQVSASLLEIFADACVNPQPRELG